MFCKVLVVFRVAIRRYKSSKCTGSIEFIKGD